MKRYSLLAWILAGWLALACGCDSSVKQAPLDGAADAAMVDRPPDADAAEGPRAVDLGHGPQDASAADRPLDASEVNLLVDTAFSTEASVQPLDAGMALDGPSSFPDTPVSADAPPAQSDTANPGDAARPEVTTVRDGGTLPGDTRVAGAWVHVSKSAVDLGRLDIGATGSGGVVVANGGSASSGVLTIIPTAGISVAGCNGPLAPMAVCHLSIYATPMSAGQFSGTVSIAADPGATTPLLVTVVALVGAGPALSVEPSAIELGTLAVGVPAPQQTITVRAVEPLSDLAATANGTADLSIDEIATTCEATLAAGAACTLAVDFTATTRGSNSAVVVIRGGGTTVSVPITAVGTSPARLVVSPIMAAFVCALGGSSSAVSFSVANAGELSTGVLWAALSGPSAMDFNLTNSCLSLAPLATCTVSVTFKPLSTSSAVRNATLTVTDMSAGDSSVSVPLSGTVVTPPTLVITSPTSDLGNVVVGSTGSPVVFGISNTGDVATGALEVSVSGPEFFITVDACSAAILGPGANCTISLVLKPTTVGVKNAILKVSDVSGHATTTKNITGIGLPGA